MTINSRFRRMRPESRTTSQVADRVVVLHGGGQSRRVWHDANYVGRLRDEFTVITVDLRGHGESDKPTSVEAYALERLTDEILAAADAAHVTRFAVWGYSYGGTPT